MLRSTASKKTFRTVIVAILLLSMALSGCSGGASLNFGGGLSLGGGSNSGGGSSSSGAQQIPVAWILVAAVVVLVVVALFANGRRP
ncbi:MAG: hypothetical protein WBR18_02230 [Anaerolineales bacterium]